MNAHIIDSGIFGDMVSTPEMKAIFDDEGILQKWLDVEAALALAQAELGVIPQRAGDVIAEKAKVECIDQEYMMADLQKSGHWVVSMVRALQKACGDAGQYIHLGATTQDIVDTAYALCYKEACHLILEDLIMLEGILMDLSRKHRDTIMAGRTHAQHAVPITFGYKTAIWMREISRNIQRMFECKTRLNVGNMTGAVGSFASFGEKGFEIQEKTLARLGLEAPDTCWHAARDRFVEFACVLGLVAGSCARIANEILNLQKTEVMELEEPISSGKVGSSTMPHKRNPSSCEWVCALAKSVRGCVFTVLSAMETEHERDSCTWRAEWISLPEACLLTANLVRRVRDICGGLIVNAAKMRENLDILGGLLLSENIMLALGNTIGKQSAHDLVYEIAMEAFEKKSHLKTALLQNPIIVENLSPDEIDRLLDPALYVGLCPSVVDCAINLTEKERASRTA